MYSLERDPCLADMAFYAAQSMHSLQGVEFDESCRDASLVDQVVFKVIKIGLPLGGKRCWTRAGISFEDDLQIVPFRRSFVSGERGRMLGSQRISDWQRGQVVSG
jgi:hypothetical protein